MVVTRQRIEAICAVLLLLIDATPSHSTDPDARCYHAPDWKMYCDLPALNGDCGGATPRYQSGFYFDQHTCTCRMARYINVACNVAQEKPVFNTLEACRTTCDGCSPIPEPAGTLAELVGTCACYRAGGALDTRLVVNPFLHTVGYPGLSTCHGVLPVCRRSEIMMGIESETLADGTGGMETWERTALFCLNFFGLLMCFLVRSI
eukprot:SAG11_NODE_7474_length_1138_cov_3.167469_1_plen_205_part_00